MLLRCSQAGVMVLGPQTRADSLKRRWDPGDGPGDRNRKLHAGRRG